ncbi:MAG TPA: S8 family serine peptidase [Puia sp.]|nr:S8 family serine peptidase [Puia sp.]
MNNSRIPSLYLSAILLLFVLSGPTADAQVLTNTPALQNASRQLSARHLALQQMLSRLAKENGWPTILRYQHGRLAYLHGLDSRGFPIYVTTTDNISAATIRTNTLWANGSTKLNLTGGTNPAMAGRIAVWDEGLVRPTHVELTGRVVQKDGNPTLSDHSTHVSGILIASGVNPQARGMAYGAQQLQTWDFENDESEMAGAAAGANGILVSSHSYADIAGWNFNETDNRWEFWGMPGDTVDINFGLYDQDTQIWDSIAYNAPFYLIAKASGNNPGEQGPSVGSTYWRRNANKQFINAGPRPTGISNNAGYNTIATYGNAKNILLIGACNPLSGGYSRPSDVVLAGFSSMGPTGDGRIKPDLVADGVNVLSSISTADNAYDIFSGTSMATPGAAGSSFLLQEYYSRLHGGAFMRSATLRGLLIHTADEAGANPGPDYTFGWGLIDMQAAAGVITSDNTDQSQMIRESSLVNTTKDAETYSVTASGKTPVKATICWTDPAAAAATIPVNEHNFADTTRRLVNDLDLRITDNTSGKVYMPWILDPKNPGKAAAKGDNIRDNVEKVELADSLVPGRTYTITVSHKGTLQRGSQAYSLLVSGVGGTPTCSSSSSASGASIDQVAIGVYTFSNPPTVCRTGSDYSGTQTFPLAAGTSTSFTVTHSSCNSTNNTRVISIYIDFNNDGTFESNELVAQSAAVPSGSFTGTIAVPSTVTVGAYARMRIIAEETSNPSAVSPCGSYPVGETQDFRVQFTNPGNDVGVTALEYPTITSCANDSQLVSVHIHNFGSVAQTGGVPVTTVVSTGPTTVLTLTATCMDSIPAGGEVIFTYNKSFPTVAGVSYTFTSTTSLGSDVNSGNNADTATITVNPASAFPAASATACGPNAASVTLHANATGDDVALWYDSQTATVPIAAGNNTTTTDITPNKTYYLGLNDLKLKGGAPNKNYFASSVPSFGGAYFRFFGNFVQFTTGVPLTIESAKMYIGHSGTIDLTLAQLASYDNNTGQYFYLPMYTTTINVYATTQHPDTAQQVNVAAGDNTDTGATFLLNIPVPNPGNYIIIFNCNNYASAFLNANIKNNPYPLTIPGIFSITGNDFRDLRKPDSITYSHQFYYPFYNIGLRLDGCPAPGRKSVTASVENGPTVSQQGDLLVSSIPAGNQWYLNDSLLTDSTTQQIQPGLPGTYYTTLVDPNTGCVLKSNVLVWTPSTGTPNQKIGLRVGPSPGPGVFHVSFYMVDGGDLSVGLYDMLGRKVLGQEYGAFTGAFDQTFSVTAAAGVYTLKIIHGSNTYYTRIIINH